MKLTKYEKLKNTLRSCLPDFWLMNSYNITYSAAWDRALNKLLDDEALPTVVNQYVMIFSDLEIWVSNYPYAYATIEIDGDKYRPKRSTMVRLRNLQQKLIPQKDVVVEEFLNARV